MKALIERSLYQPAIVLPILMLVRLMTALDFSITQIALVLAFRGSRYVFNLIIRREAQIASTQPASRTDVARASASTLSKPQSKAERTCHC